MQRHPRHIRPDLGDLDPVVSMRSTLCHTADVRPAMRALIRQHVPPSRRIGMQRPVRAGMRLGLAFRLAPGIGLLTLARRLARIIRRLRRPAQLRPQRCVLGFQGRHPRSQSVEPRQKRGDQRILLGRRKRGKIKGKSHRIVES